MKLTELTSGCRELMGSFLLTGVNEPTKGLTIQDVQYFVSITKMPKIQEKILKFDIVGKYQDQDCEEKTMLFFNCSHNGQFISFTHHGLRKIDD